MRFKHYRILLKNLFNHIGFSIIPLMSNEDVEQKEDLNLGRIC